MLPNALLSVERLEENTFAPRYLSARDEAWVQAMLSEYDDLVGLTRATVDAAWTSRIAPALQAMNASPRAAAGVRHVVDRSYRHETRAERDPLRIRECVFRHAANGEDRAAIFAASAIELGISSAAVEAGLFADCAANQCLKWPVSTLSPREVIQGYNLALAQGLLLRSERLRLVLAHSIRAVVRFAKLRGLLASFSPEGDASVRVDMSGPLSLFRNTTKYGHALATFFPVLGGTPSFRLDAICRWGDARKQVVVRSGDPIPRTHKVPREFDSLVERALTRDVRRLGGPWAIERESAILRAGARLVFPDFALVRGSDRVLVEVVGFYTQEYLNRKSEALRAANIGNLIVCVDSALNCGSNAFDRHTVLTFTRRVDAAELIAAAERLVRA